MIEAFRNDPPPSLTI